MSSGRSRETEKNNSVKAGKKGEKFVVVVPSSSGSEGPNEEKEETKSSNNSNQNMNEEIMEEQKGIEVKKAKNISNGSEVGSCCFPTNRIKCIIRSEGSDFRTTQEAIFLINKATEQFLELFCEAASASVVQDHNKTVDYKHLSSVVSKRKRYDFLSEFVPEKIRAEDALSERRLAGT